MVTTTWMPRRRRAASRTAVATDLLARVVAVLEGHQDRLVLHLVLHHRLRRHDLVGLGERQALPAPVDHVEGDADREPREPGDQHPQVQHAWPRSGPMPVPNPPKRASTGSSRPRMRSVTGERYGRSASGRVILSLMTETCAIVNESIAPKA